MQLTGFPLWFVLTLIAACTALLALLHLLRVRPREVRVVTAMFWVHAVERTLARTLLERFRHPWTYALLLLLCTLLAVALGRPRRTGEPPDRIWEVVVVDAGASMKAARPGEARTFFDEARDAAGDVLARLSSDDRAAVIVAAPWPRLIHGFDDPRPLAVARLGGTVCAGAPAALEEAVRLARSLLHGRNNAHITLVTGRPEVTDLPPAPDVRVVRVGAAVDNAAILSATFEPDRDNPFRGRLTARVGHWGRQPRDVTVRIDRAGGAILLKESRTISPGTTTDFAVADVPADGDSLTIRLEPPDAVAADDVAAYRLPLRAPIRVGVRGVAAMPASLRLAMENNPDIRMVEPGQEADIEVTTATDVSSARAGIVVVESGPPAPANRPVRTAGETALLWGLDFEGASCGTGASLAASPGGMTPLLVVDGAVVAALADEAPPRHLYLASSLLAADSTAARRAAFAVFVARAARVLAGWEEGPLVLAPERALADPLWPARSGLYGQVVAMPGSREAGNLAVEAPAQPAAAAAAGRRAMPEAFEMLLLAALVCFLVEAVLHTRGRIT